MRVSHVSVLSCMAMMLLGLSSRVGMTSGAKSYSGDENRRTVSSRPALRFSSGSFRQSATPSNSSNTETGVSLPIAVDGLLHPEQVPDHVAYRHFISVTAVGTTAPRADIHRRESILGRVGLSDADRQSYLASIANVRDELVSTDQSMRTVHHDVAAAEELRQQRASILDNAKMRVMSSLSSDGIQRLETHIRERVKRQIRIHGQVQ